MSYTTTAITTYSGNNTVEVTSIANMVSGLPIVFTGNVFGNITANATYYIGNIASISQITITSLPGGAIYAVANGTGSMTATFSDSGQQVINTVPPGDPLDVAFNKTNINFDQIFAAGPVGSNVQIADNTIRTLNTNGNLVLAPNGIGNVVSNVNIVPNTANIRNLGSPTRRWNTVYTQYIDYIAGNITFTNLAIAGNMTAGGYISAGGNVIGNYFIGNGRQLTGVSLSQISNGNSYANIPTSNGNLVVGINSNVVGTFYSAGFSVPGNVVAGNVVTNSVVGNVITISAVGGITLNTNTGNISAASQYINNILNPMQGQDAATKAYVDSVAVGLQVKEAVYLATTAALPACSYYNGPSDNGIGATLTADAVGNLTIDGVQVTTIDTRLLIQNQANAAFNGIYVVSQVPDDVTAFILTRSSDFDIASDMYGAYVLATDGAINDGNGFVCTNSAVLTPITVGYTAINFTLFSSSLVYSAGNGISIVGSVISTRVNSANLDYVGGILQVATNAAFTTPNIGSATGSTLSVTGNIAGGNISASGDVTATEVVAGSVTGDTVTANTVNTVDLVSDTAVIGNITIAGNVIGSNLDNSNIVIQANGVGLVQIAGTGGLVLPVGTTFQEPLPATTATIRFNSDTANLEFYNGSVWVTLSPVYNVANQTINGNGIDDTFVLDQFATADTVLVTINGVTQTPDVDYAIVDPDITFTTIPASGDVIQIRFLNGSLAGASGNTGGNINYIANGDSYANVVTPNGNLEINLNGTGWTFGTDGNLTFPGNGIVETFSNVINIVTAGDGSYTQIQNDSTANGSSYVWLEDGNVYVETTNGTWNFDENGGTIFPTLTTQRGDNPSGTIQGQTLLFGDVTKEAIITTPNGNVSYPNSQRLVINPGKGEDSNGGEGGDIYLWAGRGGDTNGSGGDVKIRGGQGMGQYGTGGYLRIEAGDAQIDGDAGFIEITGGRSGNAVGGFVRIQGGQGQTNGGDANLTGGFGATGLGGAVNIVGGASGNGLADYGNVNISTGASTWTFDRFGNLVLPNNTFAVNYANGDPVVISGGNASTGNVTFDNINIIGTGNLHLQPDPANAGSYLDIFLTSGPDLHLVASASANLILGKDNQANLMTSWNGNVYVQSWNPGTNTKGGTWTFANTGNLTLPNSSNFGDAAITQTDTNTSGVNSSTGVFPYLNYNVDLVGYVVNGPGVVDAVVASQDQGTSTIVITGGVFEAGETYQFSTAFGTVGTSLEVDGSTWTFGFDGVTTMPGNISVAGNIQANAFTIGIGAFTGDDQSGNGALYAGIELFTDLNSNVVVQFAGNANSYSQVNFQNIDPGISSTTDYIATADNGSDTTHFIDFGISGGSYVSGAYNSLGTSLGSNDGYVYVQGDGTGAAGNLVIGTNELNGVVRIIANGSNTANVVAEFSKAGVSVAGNILGNGSQLSGVAVSSTGSWTLSTGTNTVSLTLPEPGTYSIWVNGNIPNGIVTYTATIVLTNTNVPTVGSQYGWYYLAGNALVLTSMPNQVVGTAGGISTDVVVTTTANVFTFGITNNSGSSQVVNWGYTEL